MTPDIWAKKLIEFLWQQTRLAWDERNDEVHDTKSAKARAYEEQQCETEVNAIYAVRNQMSAYDQQLLDMPIEERLN